MTADFKSPFCHMENTFVLFPTFVFVIETKSYRNENQRAILYIVSHSLSGCYSWNIQSNTLNVKLLLNSLMDYRGTMLESSSVVFPGHKQEAALQWSSKDTLERIQNGIPVQQAVVYSTMT